MGGQRTERPRGRSCAVTGANGFIGSQVVRELLRRGFEVTALVGADLGTENLAGLPVKLRELDLLDPASVRRALAGSDAVVHSAACYAFWLPDPRHFYRVNVEGTRNVLAAARELGCRKIVYTSSTATLSPGFRAGRRRASWVTRRTSSICAASADTTRCRRRWPRWWRCARRRAACRS